MGDADATACMRDSGNGPNGDFTIKYYFATDLLGKIYRREIPWPANSASPITIAGQPALKTNDLNDALCNVAVGLADTQGFEVRIKDTNTNPCDRTIKVAETIMHNIGT
jgi:Protein of unknown function (DUF3558)